MYAKLKKKTVEKILRILRIKTYSFDGKNYQIRCVNPQHIDRNPSCYIHKDTGIWHCFSCEAKGNLLVLLKIFGRNDLIDKYIGGETGDIKDYVKQMLKMGVEEEPEDHKVCIKLPQGLDRNFSTPIGAKYLKYLRLRRLRWPIIKSFRLGFTNTDEIMRKRIIIPIYEGGKLVGYQGRSIKKHPKKKYRFPKGIKTGRVIFNIDNIKGGTVIITEGPFDTMMLTQWGYNSVAILGLNMTPYKVRKLILAGVNSVVVALDSDTGGDDSRDRIYEALCQHFRVYSVRLPRKVDIDEMDKYQWDDLYRSKKVVHKNEWVRKI